MGRRCLVIKIEKKKGYYIARLPSHPEKHFSYGNTQEEAVGRLIILFSKEIGVKIS